MDSSNSQIKTGAGSSGQDLGGQNADEARQAELAKTLVGTQKVPYQQLSPKTWETLIREMLDSCGVSLKYLPHFKPVGGGEVDILYPMNDGRARFLEHKIVIPINSKDVNESQYLNAKSRCVGICPIVISRTPEHIETIRLILITDNCDLVSVEGELDVKKAAAGHRYMHVSVDHLLVKKVRDILRDDNALLSQSLWKTIEYCPRVAIEIVTSLMILYEKAIDSRREWLRGLERGFKLFSGVWNRLDLGELNILDKAPGFYHG